MNYHQYGYQILFVAALLGITLINTKDYERRKGRDKLRKIVNPYNRPREIKTGYALERIKAGDPDWTKFLKKPPD